MKNKKQKNRFGYNYNIMKLFIKKKKKMCGMSLCIHCELDVW